MNKDTETIEDNRTAKELDFRFSHLRHVPKIGKLKSPKRVASKVKAKNNFDLSDHKLDTVAL